MRHYFTFNGTSSEAFGVWLEKEPETILGNVRAETQTVMGSAKVLHFTEGPDAMDPVAISLDLCMMDATAERIDALFAWLRGSGDLTTDYDAGHYWRGAMVTNQVAFTRVFRGPRAYTFTAEFEAEAHRYRLPVVAAYEISQGLIENPGTAPAEPLIKITGSGDIDLMIGTSTLTIDGVDGYCMVDCEAQMVYKGDVNMGAAVTRLGDWPTIPAAGCMINWSGTVTKVEITPRWRDY